MAYSQEILAEIKELRTRYIEDSIIYYDVEVLRAISQRFDDLLTRIVRIYYRNVENIQIRKAKAEETKRFESFKEDITRMIEILQRGIGCGEKTSKIMEISTRLRLLLCQVSSNFLELSDSLMAASNLAYIESLIFKKFSLKIQKFNGNPEIFDSWNEQIRATFDENPELNDLQKYSLAKYSTTGMGRTIFHEFSQELIRNRPIIAILDDMKQFFSNQDNYPSLILGFFQKVAANPVLSQEKIYKKFYLLLEDLYEAFVSKRHLEYSFRKSNFNEIRRIIISKIEEDFRETVEQNFSELRDVHNFLKSLINLKEVNVQRAENVKRNPDQILPVNSPISFKAPFIVLNIHIDYQYCHLSNSIYQGTCNYEKFVVVFNQKLDVSYIHRSLVNQDVENVFIDLIHRGNYIGYLIAFVTNDLLHGKSLVIGGSSIENIISNILGIQN